MATNGSLGATNAGNGTSTDSWVTETSRTLQIIVTLTIILIGVPLNALVVWVLGVRRWCCRSGHHGSSGETRSASSFRVYVVNLALADLVLLLRTPLMLGYLAHHFSWPFGEHFCRLVMFLRALGLYAASCLLCAVALERCLCLLRPVWASLKRPRWAVPLACGLLWLLALILASPYIHTTVLKEMKGTLQCMDSDPKLNSDTDTAFFITETIFGFLLPVTIFLSCNLAVLISAKRAESGMVTPSASTKMSPMSQPTLGSGSASMSLNQSYTARRLVRMYRVLLLTILFFLTCWVPYFIFRFLRWYTSKHGLMQMNRVAVKGYYVSLYLVYVKSMLNPILYVFAARGLGRTMRASLLSAVERVFNEDNSESLRRKSLRRKDSQI